MEITTYIAVIIISCLAFYGAIKLILKTDPAFIFGWFVLFFIIVDMIFITVFLVGGFFMFGKNVNDRYPAESIIVGEEIIVKSDAPTQIVSDIKFIDKDLEVVRTSLRSVWGYEVDYKYTVEIEK